jgi:hypothetical protein
MFEIYRGQTLYIDFCHALAKRRVQVFGSVVKMILPRITLVELKLRRGSYFKCTGIDCEQWAAQYYEKERL